MTETDVISPDAAPETSEQSPAAPERRRRGGVSGMVLAELRELAGSLGVDTSGMRRGDLIAEIKKRQSEGRGQGAAQLPLGDGEADPSGSGGSGDRGEQAAPARRRAGRR